MFVDNDSGYLSTSITAIFSLPNSMNTSHHQIFDGKEFSDKSGENSFRVGLPENVKATKPLPGDFTYSGMHDHGPLPILKEGGPFSTLIGCVKRARDSSDELLTNIIESEKKAGKRKAEELLTK
uniref:Uncharacterized protein n=1 Tax=Proboscia inermis TaxID=420281 RepID=A0A7S0C2U4_9STRA|mmetsp:Transcript_23748/g.24207  ORF Transcript_23748/g.24207 Transcript_23748/m.24207 type:complete len:124 (+) Transcript_23748:48-419(+)